MPQPHSSRGPAPVRTLRSDSDHRSITDRSPKVIDHRRSPRGTGQPEPLNQKKLGTRISDLESQLGQAQAELKILKEQLASAEAAKKEAQQELEKKAEEDAEAPLVPNVVTPEEHSPTRPEGNQHETDVYEVPVEKIAFGQEYHESRPSSLSTFELENPSFEELAMKNDELNSAKAKLEEKEREVEAFSCENKSLKSQLAGAVLELVDARTREEEMNSRLRELTKEREESEATRIVLNRKLEGVEGAKEALESEMKKMRVQTEQWKKAADAAAAVLAEGAEMNGRRISGRCGSMDTQLRSMFEMPVVGGYHDDDLDDGYGGSSGKRRSSGMKMFGDLWRKKGQK